MEEMNKKIELNISEKEPKSLNINFTNLNEKTNSSDTFKGLKKKENKALNFVEPKFNINGDDKEEF